MREMRYVIWLAVLVVGMSLVAGCVPPSTAAPGGAAAPGSAAAPTAGAAVPGDTPVAPATGAPIPGSSATAPVPDDTPAAGLVTNMGSASVSTSLAQMSPVSTSLPPLVIAGETPPEVTLADEGRTILMRVGERFTLNLGDGAAWVVASADPAVLDLAEGVPAPAGAQGVYEAQSPGSTTLTATNEPACRRARPPCLLPTRTFAVEVVVK